MANILSNLQTCINCAWNLLNNEIVDGITLKQVLLFGILLGVVLDCIVILIKS